MVNEILSKSLISQGRMVLENYKKIEKLTGSAFNVFSILKVERQELKTHSNFLYELLNPQGSHSQGNLYLKAFLQVVLKLDDFACEKAVVEQERSVGNLGRIDLVIENPDVLILIEIKIDACDQKEQLQRYEAYGKTRGKELHLFYLTLDGKEASKKSDPERAVNYKQISFESDIKNWIEECIRLDQTPHLSGIREILLQYLRVIEKITGQLEGGLKMELKDLLLKGDNLSVAENLAKAIPYAKAELELKFWKALNNKLSSRFDTLGIKSIEDDFLQSKDPIGEIHSIRKNRNGIISLRYIIQEIEEREYIFTIGCSGYSPTLYAMVTLETEEEYIDVKEWDDKIIRRCLVAELIDQEEDEISKFLSFPLNFHSDAILQLLSVDIFDEAVEKISWEVLEIAKKMMIDDTN